MNPRGLLFITIFNSILGLSVLFPILGPLGRELGLSELQVGALSTSYALMQFLTSPVWGRLSERIGRKRVLLIGIAGFCLSFLSFAGAVELGQRAHLEIWMMFALMLAARLLGGTFSSATLPTAQAYIADTTGRNERASGMALVGAAFGLGVIFGPAIGALLSRVGLLAPVYFSSLVAVLNFAFVVRFLPESKPVHEAHERKSLMSVAAGVWPLLAIGFVLSLASVAMEQTIAFHFQDRLHLAARHTPQSLGTALVAYGVVAVFAQGFLVRKLHLTPLSMLAIGLPIALLGYVALIFAGSFASLTLALAAQGLGQGLAVPGVTAGLSLGVSENEQGSVAGLNSSAQAFGRMLGPIVGTGLYQIKPEYPYALSTLLLVLVIASFAFNRRLKKAVTV